MLGIFTARHSLLLEFDHITDEVRDEMESQVAAIRDVYELVPLFRIVEAVRSGKPHGMAALVFRNARKSFFFRALPWLMEESIPFTLILRPECIGMNRLPAAEELALYREHFSDALSEDEERAVNQAAWKHPESRDAFLMELRKKVGPLPIEKLDPTRYFSTWGKILEIPPDARELGLNIDCIPTHPSIERSLSFAQTQTKSRVRIARVSGGTEDISSLNDGGFECAIRDDFGKIDRKTDLFRLPTWKMEPAESER